jgi:hypothetical protein
VLVAALVAGFDRLVAALVAGFDRLHYFVFTSSLFSHGLKGGVAATSLARVLRPTPGVGACIADLLYPRPLSSTWAAATRM